ncbi:MAG: hypothetical protein JWN63_2166 [Candidatus Acidoferrum typicum]|nr:hypothetical protein [Candidatus Acidoferrum typicum]
MRFIDGAKSVLGDPATNPAPSTTGYQVYIQSTGTATLVSGFIPDCAAAQTQGALAAGASPHAPAEIEGALSFEQTLLDAGAPLDLAFQLTLVAYPGVRDYAASLADWFAMRTQPVEHVFQQYPGVIH